MLQNVYLCISMYNRPGYKLECVRVVNCFKMCIFALACTTIKAFYTLIVSCELLQNVYLCISMYNQQTDQWNGTVVVNCFKMCIFALACTTAFIRLHVRSSCELLQNVYLCISMYNSIKFYSKRNRVVNCFKMCIFALACTTQYFR